MDVQKLEQLLQAVEKLCAEDGKITNEESDLLEIVRENISVYMKKYKQFLEDGIITPKENNELLKLWDKIYNNSLNCARKDTKISLTEFKILSKVLQTITMDK